MPYISLNEHTIADYIRNRPAMQHIFAADSPLSVNEVGDGNLNLVFIIRDRGDSRRSAVLKQALPYLRVAGESWPLTRERMRNETQALLFYNKVVPGLSPEIYDYDYEMSLVIMESLDHCEIMRKSLVGRKRLPDFVDQISTFLARTLFFTSDLYLKGVEKKALQKKSMNPELCKLQEDFVYSNPYMDAPENKWNPMVDDEVEAVRRNSRLKVAISEMKESYMTHAQALIHGDLHTGSIMVNEHETRIIDPEFAFYGPMGYDVGAVLENLVLNYLSHYAHTSEPEQRADYQVYLLGIIRDLWNRFVLKFDALWRENNTGELPPAAFWAFPSGEEAFADFRQRYIQGILHDTAGHGGCKMLRRMMGIVNVWDITSIRDLQKRALAERAAIRIGSRWVLERDRICSVEDLIGIVHEETTNVRL